MPFESERSTGALLLALIATAAVGIAYFAPWLSYDDSTGRRTPEGGYHDPNDTGIVRHHIDFGPFVVEGDIEPTNPDRADQLTTWIGVAWAAAGTAFLLMAVAEIPPFTRWMGRTVSLVLCLTAFAALATALGLTYDQLPSTMSGLGITGPFTYELVEPDGYYRTTLGLGWVAAISSVPFALGAFAFKFQAGSADPAAIEEYGRRASATPVQTTQTRDAHGR